MASDRRHQLLETAAAEFATHGFEQASLNRIIHACGMSKSSFYHYVDSKAALFDAVIDAASRELDRDLDIPESESMSGPEFWHHIDRLSQRLAELSREGSWYVDFGKLIYLPDAPGNDSPALRRVTTAIQAWLANALVVGQRSGEVRDDLPQSLLIVLTGSVVRAMDEWSIEHVKELDENEVKSLTYYQLDILKRILAPTSPNHPHGERKQNPTHG